jgi:rhodanese-related sulfurtransferase
MVVNEELTQAKVNKLSPDKAWKLLKEQRPFILDVRPQQFKMNQSYIKGAVHCPLLDLIDRLHEFPKNRPILISDWTMKQAPLAAIYLTSKNYNVVGVLKGGMKRWLFEKFPAENRKQPNS